MCIRDSSEAVAFLGRLHRTYAWLGVEDDVPPAVVRSLAAALTADVGLPLIAKAVPGSARHAQLTAAGATAYQICPPSEVDGTRPDNAAWAGAQPPARLQIVPVTEIDDVQVLDLWARVYAWVHADWAPVADEAAAREIFGPMLADALARELSVVAVREGAATAIGYAVRDPGGLVWVVAEAVERHLPSAPEDVGAVMRAVVRLAAEAGEPMLFDGHVSDPNYPQVLATIPHVTGVGLELLRLG